MQHVFLDESGDLGFTGGSTHFVIALLSPQSGSALSKVMKNFNAHLVNVGWNKSVEIKATNLFNCPRNADIPDTFGYKKCPETPIGEVLKRIAALQVEIDYAVVRLSTVYDYLKQLPDAILYNYFSFQVLSQRLALYPAVSLWVDKRNREYHRQLHFDGYLRFAGLPTFPPLGRVPIIAALKAAPPLTIAALGILRDLCSWQENSDRNEKKDTRQGLRGWGLRTIREALHIFKVGREKVNRLRGAGGWVRQNRKASSNAGSYNIITAERWSLPKRLTHTLLH